MEASLVAGAPITNLNINNFSLMGNASLSRKLSLYQSTKKSDQMAKPHKLHITAKAWQQQRIS